LIVVGVLRVVDEGWAKERVEIGAGLDRDHDGEVEEEVGISVNS
jgi:hypothetical protein